MTDQLDPFVPANPYDESKEKGRFSTFEPGTRTLPKGWQYGKEFEPLPVDILFEKDVEVTLRDGTKIYTDIFRPVGATNVPVIVAWSPYGKSRGSIPSITAMRSRIGIDQSKLSGLMKWEAPDPAFWVSHGYAIANPDARGAFNSEGDLQFFGEQEGRDGADFVEWVAQQPWCNGKVGTCGNSWLAIAQWFIAAEQPPHLAAIAPWEGLVDLYRDLILRGGIPDTGFAGSVLKNTFIGNQKMEDPLSVLRAHPLDNPYWHTKNAKVENITVPAYVVASYSSTVHSPGTFEGWRRLSSPEKWLRIHNHMEWPDFYNEQHQLDLKAFFDHYLKEEDNDWPVTPPVRYAVLDLEGGDFVDVEATQFPPATVEYSEYFLDADNNALTTTTPGGEATIAYDAEKKSGQAEFMVTFDQETQLVGYPKVKLWVEADGYDDMDLFVFLQKLDAKGRHLDVMNVDTKNPMLRLLTRNGASILRYKSSNGRIRASRRHLDENLSTDELPYLSLDRDEKLRPGEIVPVEIGFLPIGLLLHPGESVRLVVSGHNITGAQMPGVSDLTPDNRGRHIIHTGGKYDSYLQLPMLR